MPHHCILVWIFTLQPGQPWPGFWAAVCSLYHWTRMGLAGMWVPPLYSPVDLSPLTLWQFSKGPPGPLLQQTYANLVNTIHPTPVLYCRLDPPSPVCLWLYPNQNSATRWAVCMHSQQGPAPLQSDSCPRKRGKYLCTPVQLQPQ